MQIYTISNYTKWKLIKYPQVKRKYCQSQLKKEK